MVNLTSGHRSRNKHHPKFTPHSCIHIPGGRSASADLGKRPRAHDLTEEAERIILPATGRLVKKVIEITMCHEIEIALTFY